MTEKERAFFDWWEKIEQHVDLYNLRMAFDAGYEAGAGVERRRVIEVLQTDKAFDAVYYDEMGADGALGDLITLITKEAK
jgi:hypothetical protein